MLAFFAAGLLPIFAHALDSQIEMNGFLLGQYKACARAQYGTPFRTLTAHSKDDTDVFALGLGTGTHMIFSYEDAKPPREPRIVAMQINGADDPAVEDFRGIKLGAGKKFVKEKFGKASDEKKYRQNGVGYETWSYAGKNFSVEFNQQEKVSSIRLAGSEGFPLAPAGFPSLDPLADALKKESKSDLLKLLAPDFEIYQGGKVLRYEKSALAELSNPTSKIFAPLLGKEKSLKAALMKSKEPADSALRILEETNTMMYVFKFSEKHDLKEIVYRVRSGAWAVYEIAFR